MIFLEFRKAFFASTAVLILIEIKTSAHNSFESNNSTIFNTTHSFPSSQVLKSEVSNGRMRSFAHEEEDEIREERYRKSYISENEILDSRSEITEGGIKLVSTQMPTKLEIKSSYLYPILHYEIEFDLTQNNSINLFNDTKLGSNRSSYLNITKPLEPSNSKNKLKSNESKLIKVVKPRYGYKNSHSMHFTQNPINNFDKNYSMITEKHNNFDDNYTIIAEKHNQTDCSDLKKESINTSSIESKNEKLIQYNNESSISEDLQNSNSYKNKELNYNSIKVEFSSTISSLNETETLKKFENLKSFANSSERFCITSSDCYIELNERCIIRSKYSVCGCKDQFFRETITQKCQIKKLIRLIFKISSLNYSNDFNNTNSLEFIQMKHLIERAIWSLIINSSHLLTIVDNVKVVKFIPFSVMVDFYVRIANPTNNFHHKYTEYHFWYKLMAILKSINISHKSTDKLSALDLKAIEIDNNINYCSIKELNYCSENAFCTENSNTESKFECKCNKGLTDLSPNSNYSGEICVVECNSQYCGTGGFCEIKDGTHLHCICTNWSFGSRCQYSTNVLLSVFALFFIAIILFAFCFASIYCANQIRLEFNGLRSMIESTSNMENTLQIV